METQDSTEFAWPKVGRKLGGISSSGSYWDRSKAAIETVGESSEPATLPEEDGYAVGLEQGRQAGAAEYERQINLLHTTLTELEETRKEISSAAVKEASQVVHAMFTALFRVELQTNPVVLEKLIESVTQSIEPESAPIRIGIAQEDYQRLSAEVSERFGTRVFPEQVTAGTVRVTADSLVREIDLVGNLEQLIAAGISEDSVE